MHAFHDLPLILVSGVGRSGTTLLRNCVAAHPLVYARNHESNYFYQLMRGANLASENAGLVENLAVEIRHFWDIHREMVLNLYWPQAEKNKSPKLAISTYSMLDPRAAIGLKATFQDMSLVYIVRNGIEVVSSYRSFEAFQHLSFEQVCEIWSVRYDMIQYCEDNDHAFLLRYEWIRDERERWENTLGSAFQQIGLQFENACRGPMSKNFHPTRFTGESRKDSVSLEKRVERWRLWDNAERKTFEEICGETMNRLGYAIPWR